MHDPDRVRAMATGVLGAEPSWEELYGVADPHALTPEEREIAFGHACAGHGNDRRLRVAGVPAQPTGPAEHGARAVHDAPDQRHRRPHLRRDLRRARVLRRRARRAPAGVAATTSSAPSRSTHLACNHADPTISLGVYDLVFRGAQVAFADPLGMYIRRPNLERLLLRAASRCPPTGCASAAAGRARYQRLVFGPPDEHEAFLDDITLSLGASEQPLTGGYQLLRELEIGPLVQRRRDRPDRRATSGSCSSPPRRTIACDDAESCKPVRDLLARYEAEHAGRKAPRTMPEPGA